MAKFEQTFLFCLSAPCERAHCKLQKDGGENDFCVEDSVKELIVSYGKMFQLDLPNLTNRTFNFNSKGPISTATLIAIRSPPRGVRGLTVVLEPWTIPPRHN